MSETTTETFALTRDHVKALRNADDAWLRMHEGGAPVIVARKRTDAGDGFGAQDVEIAIPLDETLYRIYGEKGSLRHITPRAWFFSIHSCRFSPEWRTFTRLVKAGDRVRAAITTGNSTLIREAGLVLDEIALEIIRGEPGPRQVRLFIHLGSVTAPAGTGAGRILEF